MSRRKRFNFIKRRVRVLSMKPEKPRSSTRTKWLWLGWVGSLALMLIVLLARALASNTRAVTFRFIDAKTGEPVTNVVVTATHKDRSVFPNWVIRVAPVFPRMITRTNRSLLCASDRITVSNIPAAVGESCSIAFTTSNYFRGVFIAIPDDRLEGRFVFFSGLGSSSVNYPPTTNLVVV